MREYTGISSQKCHLNYGWSVNALNYAAGWKMSKLRVSLCRKNGSDRDLNELAGIAILRPFRSGIQVRIPEIIGSWVRRRRAKVDEKLVARNAVCARIRHRKG